MIVLALPACGGGYEGGSHGKLVFFDQTDTAESFNGIRPIAAGATLHVDAYHASDGAATLSDVTSSKASVLSVGGFAGNAFTLKAGKPGTSRIVGTADPTLGCQCAHTEDSIDLSVEAIESSELRFVSYDSWGTLTRLGTPVPGSFPDIALAPDVRETLVLWHWSTSGKSLTGFGAEAITATPTSAVVPKEDSDIFTLVAPHDVGAAITLHAGTLDYNIRVVDPATVATLALRVYGPHTGATLGDAVGAAFTVPVGKWMFRLDARLADGRYLLASCPDFAVSSSVPGRAVLTPDPGPYGLQADQRWFTLDFKSTGKTTLTLTCLGRTLSSDVTVQPSSG